MCGFSQGKNPNLLLRSQMKLEINCNQQWESIFYLKISGMRMFPKPPSASLLVPPSKENHVTSKTPLNTYGSKWRARDTGVILPTLNFPLTQTQVKGHPLLSGRGVWRYQQRLWSHPSALVLNSAVSLCSKWNQWQLQLLRTDVN